MTPDFVITLTPAANAIVRNFETLPKRMLQAIAGALDRTNAETVGWIQERHLSFPKTGPTTLDGLRVITGSLRRALHFGRAVVQGDSVVSSIGNNVNAKGVNYARTHEFGAVILPRTITAKNAKFLKFTGRDGNPVFRRQVKHPGAVIPARAPIQRGIRYRLPIYTEEISKAILLAAMPPTR